MRKDAFGRSKAVREKYGDRRLEVRTSRFGCGCDLEKIMPVLGGWRERPDELFGEEDKVVVQCPRCAARYLVTRDMLL